MKRLIFIITFSTLIQFSFGQINPINNLEWSHWYVCPYNYFILSWEPPDPSQDTLIGYNIYRNNDLYIFQTENILNHEESGGNCPEDFLVYNGCQDFWIHVTALYNSIQSESEYIDSVYCGGIVISGIKETKQSNLKLFPNPTTGKINIDTQTIKKILIMNQAGEILQENNKKTEIDLSNFPKGTYLIKIITGKEIFVKKITHLLTLKQNLKKNH